jgi:hypothetical protein
MRTAIAANSLSRPIRMVYISAVPSILSIDHTSLMLQQSADVTVPLDAIVAEWSAVTDD